MSELFTHDEYHDFQIEILNDAVACPIFVQRRQEQFAREMEFMRDYHGENAAASASAAQQVGETISIPQEVGVLLGLAHAKTMVAMLTERKLKQRAEAAFDKLDPKDMSQA